MTKNHEAFEAKLAEVYRELFVSDPGYASVKERYNPEVFARKMTAGLLSGSAHKDGTGIKRVCAHFGIKTTYTAIREFLNSGEQA